VVSCFEYSDEHPGSTKRDIFLDQLSDLFSQSLLNGISSIKDTFVNTKVMQRS
jgi:hypothetical protein